MDEGGRDQIWSNIPAFPRMADENHENPQD
jgi:hypothetical protein